MGNTKNNMDTPGSGEFITDAQGNGEEIEAGGVTGEGDISDTLFGADPRANILAKDTYTGRVVLLPNIKIRIGASSIMNGLTENQSYRLYCPSYESFKKRETERMYLVPSPEQPVVQNQSLPQPIKVKDTLGGFGETPSAMCKAYNENMQAAQKKMGLIHNRNDLNILQGKKNGRSPGVAVSQTTGKIFMFDNTGKQSISMDGQGIQHKANEVDHGSAKEGRNFFGFPAMKNPVNDIVPQGTILSPSPRLIPNVTKFANMLNTILDMVELVDACADAVKIISNTESGSPERRTAEQELVDDSKYSEWEKNKGE